MHFYSKKTTFSALCLLTPKHSLRKKTTKNTLPCFFNQTSDSSLKSGNGGKLSQKKTRQKIHVVPWFCRKSIFCLKINGSVETRFFLRSHGNFSQLIDRWIEQFLFLLMIMEASFGSAHFLSDDDNLACIACQRCAEDMTTPILFYQNL